MTAINSNRAIRGPVTAVPVVAGKGVRLVADTENNRWVVEADETVLFTSSDSNGDAGDIQLSEPITNFEQIEFTYTTMPTCCGAFVERFDAATVATYNLFLNGTTLDGTTGQTIVFRNKRYTINSAKDKFTISVGSQVYYNGTTWTKSQNNDYVRVFKVVGINRVSGGN